MKTISLKKVTVIAVASLGFGLLSVVPANAAATAPLIVDSTTTAVQTPTAPGAALIALGTMTATTQPGASFVAGVLTNSVASITVPNGSLVSVGLNSAVEMLDTDSIVCTVDGNAVVQEFSAAARASGLLEIPAAIMTVSGTKTVTCTVSNTDILLVGAPVSVSFSLIVTALAAPSTTSTVFLGSGNAGAVSTSDTLTPFASSATGATTNAGHLSVTIRDTNNAITSNFTQVAATITSGPGFLVAVRAAVPTASSCAANGTGLRAASSTAAQVAGAVTHFVICPDGTSGVSTVAVTLTDRSTPLVTTTISTKTFTFFGAVAKLEILSPACTIGLASSNGGNTCANAAGQYVSASPYTTRANATDVPAFIVKATDRSGTAVGNLTLGSTTSDSTVATGATCAADVASAAFSSGGVGFYNCFWTTPANATSGKAGTVTVRIANPADSTGLTFLTAVLPVTVGGVIASQTMALSAASYAPGAAATLTVTNKDAAGNPAADGLAVFAANPTANKAVGGALPTAAASVSIGGKFTTSANSLFAPAVSGSWVINATGGDAVGAALSATATVTDGNAAIATSIASLNAKIVALNALIAKIMKRLNIR